ncbi:hypothetical protein BH23CYA1_BH23CYA1_16050 [soil metagenome]
MVESTRRANQTKTGPSSEEVADVIADLEKYRQRLLEDFMATTQKAKLPKSMVMTQLENHSELCKIDASLAQLRQPLTHPSPDEG